MKARAANLVAQVPSPATTIRSYLRPLRSRISGAAWEGLEAKDDMLTCTRKIGNTISYIFQRNP